MRLACTGEAAHNTAMLDFISDSGRIARARWVPSPNCDARPVATNPSMLVLHCISLPPGRFGGGEIEALFCNRLDCRAHPYFDQLRDLKVSSHFLIDRAGELVQFVDCDQRAWHAGRSSYCGSPNCNDVSIGIELEGTETGRYEDAQYAMLAALIPVLRVRYPALAQGPIVAHSDIAPGRKTDPGPAFDWTGLHRRLRDRHPIAQVEGVAP